LLKDYYSSTEEHELRWVYVIGGLGFMFWLANAALLFLEFDGEQADTQSIILHFGSIAALALVGATTIWGLRQRPPLMPDLEPSPTHASPDDGSSEQGVGKYEKSALNAEISSRIAGKLRKAMEKDHLHRDPNLSLWALSRHIGASPNYVSQTLNEVIGESFFDFVNGYRIAEAMTRLETTNDNVLTITYDVGFNARSSFYNAFKRVLGQTPTNYRKNSVST
jgi:AraC-like DNA-binding protein